MLTVTQLNIYPIKSLGGTAVPVAELSSRGLQFDRRWMLVDQQDRFLTQREVPSMALLHASVMDDMLSISTGDITAGISVPVLNTDPATRMVTVWSDRCRVQPVSAAVDDWFSDALGIACRLVFMPDTTRRLVDGRYSPENALNSFSDCFPISVISQETLDDLNNRLSEKVCMDRFRPNIVISGGHPFCEDELQQFSIGKIRFRAAKKIARCSMISINQQDSSISKEPVKTLATYRRTNNKIYFGQNLLHQGSGSIRVGDTLIVIPEVATSEK